MTRCKIIVAIAMTATALLAQQETNEVAAAEALAEAAPTNAVPSDAGSESATIGQEDVDEIDLEEIDDTAEAAKHPQIRTDNEDVEFVDISCDEATLADVLRQFRKTTRANIISDDSTNLQRRVSAELKHVQWLDALQSLLNARGFRLEQRGNIYFVNEDKMAVPIVTKTFQLNHASAEELATLFNENYAVKGKDGKTVQKIANAFPGANVVVVTAPEKVISDCEAIIRSVDKAVGQIYIEARFIELSSEALHKLGFDWSQLKSWGATAHGLEAGWEYNNGRVAKYHTTDSATMYTPKKFEKTEHGTYENLADGKSAVDYITKNYLVPSLINEASGAGRTATDMSWRNARGFSGQLSADDFRLAISAFESVDDAKIFSNPKVIVSNGKEAKVDMTTKFPNVKLTASNSNSGGAFTDNYSADLDEIKGDSVRGLFAGSCFFEWGITLSVKPRISPDGLISVEITPSISQLDYEASVDGSGFYSVKSANTMGLYPIINMKSIKTFFTMKDGSTAVIGGLSRTTEEEVDSGIPYLRKLPWIGQRLFGNKSRQKVQKEIIVCVTVGIAQPDALPKDIGLPKNAVIGREYVEGRRLEPGDRPAGAADLQSLDLRSLDRRRRDAEKAAANGDPGYGSVTITPSK